MVFTDIQNVKEVGESKINFNSITLPYETDYHTNKEREEYEVHAREYYAVGVVILEVLVGTEYVM